jgi:lipoprotein-anchoring transpeptidase ErfK/SrfK
LPTYNYNPALFWDAAEGDWKAVLQPGPNNPVGVVWIDLDKPHYGIHGTPEPA